MMPRYLKLSTVLHRLILYRYGALGPRGTDYEFFGFGGIQVGLVTLTPAGEVCGVVMVNYCLRRQREQLCCLST